MSTLSPRQPAERCIAARGLYEKPFWHPERARIGTSRKVQVELIINGEAIEATEISADGTWKDVSFTRKLNQSSWVALRIYPSVHTNPVFVEVNRKPVRVLKSIEWCRASVDQCWKMKSPKIRQQERAAAQQAYDAARAVYDKRIKEAKR